MAFIIKHAKLPKNCRRKGVRVNYYNSRITENGLFPYIGRAMGQIRSILLLIPGSTKLFITA